MNVKLQEAEDRRPSLTLSFVELMKQGCNWLSKKDSTNEQTEADDSSSITKRNSCDDWNLTIGVSHYVIGALGIATSLISMVGLRYCLIKLNRYRNGLPVQGPVGLPFYGVITKISDDSVWRYYGEKYSKYGIFTARFGSKDIVIINDLNVYKETFKSNKYFNTSITRPYHLNSIMFGPTKSYFFGNDNWYHRRKFMLKYQVLARRTSIVNDVFDKLFVKQIKEKLDEKLLLLLLNSKNGVEWNDMNYMISKLLFSITYQVTFNKDFDTINKNDCIMKPFYQYIVYLAGNLLMPFLFTNIFRFKFLSEYLFGIKNYSYSEYFTNKCVYKTFYTPFHRHINDLINKSKDKILIKKEKPQNVLDYAIYFGINNNNEKNDCKYKYNDYSLLSDIISMFQGRISSLAIRCTYAIYLLTIFPEYMNDIYFELIDIFSNKKYNYKLSNQSIYL